MLKASILSIGDEILIGQILNSNSKYLADKLTNLSCKVVKISTIGDSEEEITSELDYLQSISDVIVITGGLGPTHDDITKYTICSYFGDTLEEQPEWTAQLKKFFDRRGVEFSERNRLQAYIPSRSKLLWNRLGTAPGMLIENAGKMIFSLPGVPQEMVCIMEDGGFDIIANKIKEVSKDRIIYQNIQTNGIGESFLADLIDISPEVTGKSTLAFLPSFRGVKLRIGAYGIDDSSAQAELNRLRDYILPRIKEYVISENERNYAEIVAELLVESGKTISCVESCTSGLLAAAFTDIAGSSKYFVGGLLTYSNECKVKLANVSAETLEKYGAVSQETAIEMSRNTREILGTDIAVSITGIAGPDGGTPEKPVGTVWVSISDANGDYPVVFKFGGSREMIRSRTVQSALVEVIKYFRK